MKKISFIHAADLHLDSPMVGLKFLPETIFTRIKESTFTALRKITATAIERKVDFVILAGDLFDGEDRSLRAQSRLRREMLKLEENGIPVYVVHGNHDHLNGSWIDLKMPANVHVFGSQVEMKTLFTKTGAKVHLYGFSYPTRHVFERKIDQFQKIDGGDFHIGILHGNESSSSEHDNYAPFTVKDLREKEFDYWALGHIHKRTTLSEHPPIIYPGNIQGRSRKEAGVKGFYHVSLSQNGVEMSLIESADIIWEEAEIDVSSAGSFFEVFQLCREEMNRYRKDKIGTLLTVYLKNINLEDDQENKSIHDELVELLLEEELEEESFVWIVDLQISESKSTDKEQLAAEAGFYAELFHTLDHYDNFDHALAPLYRHTLGRKYTVPLSRDEQREVLKKAEKLLLNLLNK